MAWQIPVRSFSGRWALATILGLTFCASSTSSLVPTKSDVDPRFARLERFFLLYECPAPHYVEAYLRRADDYGLDYRLLPAISVRETQCGVYETQNNRWGYAPGRRGFASVEAGIDHIARQLTQSRAYAGKTMQQKLLIYNPKPLYPGEVIRIMRQIK